MKSRKHKYSITFLFIIIRTINSFTQEHPSISIFSSNAFFVNTITTESNSKYAPGSKMGQPVLTTYTDFLYEFRISYLVKEKGDLLHTPLNLKITSPGNISEIFFLEEDISLLDEKIYDYKFNITTNETGWFKVELLGLDQHVDFESSGNNIVFAKTQVYFDNLMNCNQSQKFPHNSSRDKLYYSIFNLLIFQSFQSFQSL